MLWPRRLLNALLPRVPAAVLRHEWLLPRLPQRGLRWASDRAYLEKADAHDSTFLGKAWSQLGALGLWMLSVLLHPLDQAFTQALEAVCSRGPV